VVANNDMVRLMVCLISTAAFLVGGAGRVERVRLWTHGAPLSVTCVAYGRARKRGLRNACVDLARLRRGVGAGRP
jgi:hypothetical protein